MSFRKLIDSKGSVLLFQFPQNKFGHFLSIAVYIRTAALSRLHFSAWVIKRDKALAAEAVYQDTQNDFDWLCRKYSEGCNPHLSAGKIILLKP